MSVGFPVARALLLVGVGGTEVGAGLEDDGVCFDTSMILLVSDVLFL